jgi:hypothetical protein
LTIRKDDKGKLILDILPGDPIAPLDGKLFIRKEIDEGRRNIREALKEIL